MQSHALFAATLIVGLATGASGQSDSAWHRRDCSSARPAPTCDGFFVTEAEGAVTHRTRDDKMMVMEFGYMLNWAKRPALGITVFRQVGLENLAGFGLRPRARFWLADRWSLDVAPGIFSTAQFSKRTGASLLLALNTPVGAITTTRVIVRDGDNPNVNFNKQFIGFRGGGVKGAVVTLTLLVLIAANTIFGGDIYLP